MASTPSQTSRRTASSTANGTPQRSGRGFAGMDPARQREIASAGGRAAHASGNAHEFTSEEARAAGRKSHANDANRARGGSRSGGASAPAR